jgi:hypothetical protein
MLDSLAHHVGHERVQPERSRNKIADAAMLARGRRGEMWNVIVPMAAWKQEVGEHDDSFCASSHALRKRSVDRRLGQLHVGWFNDSNASVGRKLSDDIQQQLVTLAPTRPMIDDNDTNALFVVQQ